MLAASSCMCLKDPQISPSLQMNFCRSVQKVSSQWPRKGLDTCQIACANGLSGVLSEIVTSVIDCSASGLTNQPLTHCNPLCVRTCLGLCPHLCPIRHEENAMFHVRQQVIDESRPRDVSAHGAKHENNSHTLILSLWQYLLSVQ